MLPTASPESTMNDLVTSLSSDLVTARGPRVTARTLCEGDIERAVAAHAKLLALAAGDDVRAVTTLRGGYIPGAYKYRAESDEVTITSLRGDTGWVTTAQATRATAQRRPNGIGALTVHRLARAGQVRGRTVEMAS